jgi:hypothetical protein
MWDQRVQQDKVHWQPLIDWLDGIEPRLNLYGTQNKP